MYPLNNKYTNKQLTAQTGKSVVATYDEDDDDDDVNVAAQNRMILKVK